MFYEASPAAKSSKLLRELRRSAPKESVFHFVSNDLHATTHSEHEPWLLAAVASSGGVAIEAIAAVSSTASPFRDAALGKPNQKDRGGTDAFFVPCRNAAETLRAHNIAPLSTSTSAAVSLHDTFHWIHASSSVWSGPSLVHHKRLFSMRNASRLPTIASIVDSKIDKKRFLMVLTPYNPAVEASPAVIHDARQVLRHNYVDPMARINSNSGTAPTSSVASNVDALRPSGGRAPLIERFEIDPARRTFDPAPSDILTAIRDDDNNEGSLGGIEYTMSLCQIAPASFGATVSPDGSLIVVLQPTDLVARSTGGGGAARCTAPLVIRPSSPLHVASIGFGALQVAGADTAAVDATLCWAGAAPSHPIVEWLPSAAAVMTFAALFSDGTLKVFAICGANVEAPPTREQPAAGSDGRHETPVVFSPAEGGGSSALSPSRSRMRERPNDFYLHCTGIITTLTSTSSAGTSHIAVTQRTCCARLSPNGGLVAFVPATGKEVVVAPIGHGVSASLTTVVANDIVDGVSDATILKSLVWLPPTASNVAFSGLLVVSQQGHVWWCGASGANLTRPIHPRRFVLDIQQTGADAWDETPRMTMTQRRGALASVQGFFGDSDSSAGSVSEASPLPSLTLGLVAFPRRATGVVAGLGAQVMCLVPPSSSVDGAATSSSTPPLLASVMCSCPPSADRVIAASLSSALSSMASPPQEQQLPLVVSHLYFGAVGGSFSFAWETILASLPKSNPGLMTRIGVAATQAYLQAVDAALPLNRSATRLRPSLIHSAGSVLPATSCWKDLEALKHHIYLMLLAHGCISAVTECAAFIGSSPLFSGTLEAAQIADIAISAVLSIANTSVHASVLRSSCSNTYGSSNSSNKAPMLWDTLMASCLPHTKMIFNTVIAWENAKARLAAQEAEVKQLSAAGSVPSAAVNDPFPSFVEVERSAVSFMEAVKAFQQSVDNNTASSRTAATTTWTRHTISSHFNALLHLLDAELTAFIVYLLLTRAAPVAVTWLKHFLEHADVIKDHHDSIGRTMSSIRRVVPSAALQ